MFVHRRPARSLHQQDVLLKLGGEREATHFLAHLGTNFPQSIKLLKTPSTHTWASISKLPGET